MPKIIALFNQSGGVGKTTLTMNLGYHLGQAENRVLLVDIDPQASLTIFMGQEPEELEQTIYQSLVGNYPLKIIRDINGIDLVPANIDLSAAEMELVSSLMREARLKNALDTVADDYDYILIDCPPSLGILTVLSLVAATHVLVPIQAQYKSFRGTELLLNTVATLRESANPNLELAGFIPTLFDSRTAQESRTYKAINEQLSPLATVYTPIPRSIVFPDASEKYLPLALYQAKHPAVNIMKKIVAELEAL